MLQSLLRMKCRTLTCAPTNVAVLEVTERVVKKVKAESGKYDTYGLGDIVLFGNGERMKIDDRDELCDVFLDHRIDILGYCFAAGTGWRDSLLSMISLLVEPQKHHGSYLENKAVKRSIGGDSDSDDDMNKSDDDMNKSDNAKRNQGEGGSSGEASEEKDRMKALKKAIIQTSKENKKKDKVKKGKNETEDDEKSRDDQCRVKDGREGEKADGNLIFGEFVKKRFDFLAERLHFCMVNLYTHLPTSLISQEVVEAMFAAIEALKSFQKLLRGVASKELEDFFGEGKASKDGRFSEFRGSRMRIILLLKLLPSTFPVPPYSTDSYSDRKLIQDFFLANACLTFCTVSSSAKLHIKSMVPWELLVIDEAAQLKECESTIPLQLPGIRHAVLIGDERQLPAMVKSKVFELYSYTLFPFSCL